MGEGKEREHLAQLIFDAVAEAEFCRDWKKIQNERKMNKLIFAKKSMQARNRRKGGSGHLRDLAVVKRTRSGTKNVEATNLALDG